MPRDKSPSRPRDLTTPRPDQATGNILVVQCIRDWPLRASVEDHTRAFARYSPRRCFYLNLPAHSPARIPRDVRFDLILFDTTFVGSRWAGDFFVGLWDLVRPLRGRAAVAAMLPQDEFIRADLLCRFIDDMGIDWVFSVAPESEWDKIYAGVDQDRVRFQRVLTGYLDTATLGRIERIAARQAERAIDIGYRAKTVAPWLGRQGQLKPGIAERVEPAARLRGLSVDISTRAEDTLFGDAWFEFLARSKYTIGVEGGSSILDVDGSVRARTEAYLEAHPGASFEQVEAACFPGRDGETDLVAISPRHLEACATRTCQILVEGSYGGILKPGVHYLALRRDMSNLDDILTVVARDDVRERLVEAAHRDVVASGNYTYERFVAEVEDATVGDRPRLIASRASDRALRIHRRHERRAEARARMRSAAAEVVLKRFPDGVVRRLQDRAARRRAA